MKLDLIDTIYKTQPSVNRAMREQRIGFSATTIWITGLSGSGKSTLAHGLEKHLYDLGCNVYVLDGDNVRHGLCADLGFSEADRSENIRRIGEVCKLMMDAGVVVIAAFISPLAKDRNLLRKKIGEDFVEVYCKASLADCEQRDIKGLYKRARSGEIKHFTGISSPYDVPENPDIVIDTSMLSVEASLHLLIAGVLSNITLKNNQIAKTFS